MAAYRNFLIIWLISLKYFSLKRRLINTLTAMPVSFHGGLRVKGHDDPGKIGLSEPMHVGLKSEWLHRGLRTPASSTITIPVFNFYGCSSMGLRHGFAFHTKIGAAAPG
jgi:hypothetical protein